MLYLKLSEHLESIGVLTSEKPLIYHSQEQIAMKLLMEENYNLASSLPK